MDKISHARNEIFAICKLYDVSDSVRERVREILQSLVEGVQNQTNNTTGGYMSRLKEQYAMETGLRCTHPTEGFVFDHYVNWLEDKVEKFIPTNKPMPKLPTLTECQAYIQREIWGSNMLANSVSITERVYNFICKKLSA